MFLPIEVFTAIRDAGLPYPDDQWLGRCRDTSLTAAEVVALHRHRLLGLPTSHAPHHARFAVRRDGGLEVVECACGAFAYAVRFSRDEEAAWWQQHLEQVTVLTP